MWREPLEWQKSKTPCFVIRPLSITEGAGRSRAGEGYAEGAAVQV